MVAKKEYFRRLDVIRIIACIMVLLYHLNVLKGGFLAVCTFFTLTGYLDTISALKNREFSIKSYYIKKIKNIYFPLIIVVSVTVILAKLIPNINWMNLKPETISVIFGYNNFWQLKVNSDYFTKNINSPFIHFWYISILMQFEILFPIVFVILKKISEKFNRDISTILVILINISFMIVFFYMSKTQNIMTVYYNTIARSFSIVFGICLAVLNYKHDIGFFKIFKKFNTPVFWSYIFLFIGLCIFVSAESGYYAIFMLLITIISCRMIEYATIESQIQDNRFIQLLSKVSYEIYLVQYPIIFFMQKFSMNNIFKVIITIIITVIISFVLNWLINIEARRKKAKVVKNAFFSILIVSSIFVIVLEKDHTIEMKELENILNENSKIIEERKNDYNNSKTQNMVIQEENTEVVEVATIVENVENEEISAKEKTQMDKSQIEEKIKNLKIVGVGDSILLGAIDELYSRFPNGYFDGKISRRIKQAESLLVDLENEGRLSDTVVLNLANNGDYSNKINTELMEILGDRKIYWINAVGADDPQFNDRFKEFAKDYPNIHIVEWNIISEGHPEYFYADGIHLKPAGIEAYVNAVYEAIYNDYLEEGI